MVVAILLATVGSYRVCVCARRAARSIERARPPPSQSDRARAACAAAGTHAAMACFEGVEARLTTAKVRGDEPMAGCCCCLNLRGGVLTMSAFFAAFEVLGLGYNLYAIADKGLGIPEGYPPEFPSLGVLSAMEVLGVVWGAVSAAVFGVCLIRAAKYELKGMRAVFRIVGVFWLMSALLTLVGDPILNNQMCNELEAEHKAACAPMHNKSACLAVTNPVIGSQKERCHWKFADDTCTPCVGCSAVACEVGAFVFQLLMIGVPVVVGHGYFLFVLNAYIVRFEKNEGASIMAGAEGPGDVVKADNPVGASPA
jgi:hypothetical protein